MRSKERDRAFSREISIGFDCAPVGAQGTFLAEPFSVRDDFQGKDALLSWPSDWSSQLLAACSACGRIPNPQREPYEKRICLRATC